MASVSISGQSGNRSGSFAPGPGDQTSYFAYSTGWSTIPLGSSITLFNPEYYASLTGSASSGINVATAYADWPVAATVSNSGSGNQSATASAGAVTPHVFFLGNPGDTGRANCYTTDSFYPVDWAMQSTANTVVYFDPPSSRTLFFGTAS